VAPTALVTPGSTADAASEWKSFAWGTAAAASIPFKSDSALLKWSHGFAVSGQPTGQTTEQVWTSNDGVTWMEAAGVSAPQIFVAEGPKGLVAIGLDPNATHETQTVWTSSDGRTWAKAGTTSGIGNLDSLAGNSTTLVAIWDRSEAAGPAFSLETSVDAINWTSVSQVAFQSSISWVPFVDSIGGRLFALGAPQGAADRFVPQNANVFMSTAAPRGAIWWSDDGKAWHASGGSFSGLPDAVYAAANGLLLEGTLGSVPGGDTLAYSTDGGQTWTDDPSFAPLGQADCTGECSSVPDGYYSSNGSVIVAVKSDGSKAWISTDARTWTEITWGGPRPSDTGGFMALPGGVLAGDQYGAGK
jgi:hypothetical protein